MKTELLFYSDPYAAEFTAQVLECAPDSDKWRIVLDCTCFYPEGGGQPGDTGRLNEVNILDTRVKDGIVSHIADGPLNVGAQAMGAVDFARRYRFMQNHAGEHIISGLAREYFGARNVGFNLAEAGMRIDFDVELSDDDLARLERGSNEATYRNLPITACFYSQKDATALDYRSKKELTGDIRIITVEDYDTCACAGLHVARTGEIGIFKIISHQRYKGGSRILAVCGYDALDDYRGKHEQIAQISAGLSAKPNEASAAVRRMSDELAQVRFAKNNLQRQIFTYKTNAISEDSPFALFFEEGLTPQEMQLFANEAVVRATVVLIFSENAGNYNYLLFTNGPMDLRDLANAINAAFGGRGGGKPNAPQGMISATRQDIERFIEEKIK